MLAADMQIDDLLNKVKLLQDRETELLDAIEGAVKVIKTLRDRADWYPAQRAQIADIGEARRVHRMGLAAHAEREGAKIGEAVGRVMAVAAGQIARAGEAAVKEEMPAELDLGLAHRIVDRHRRRRHPRG